MAERVGFEPTEPYGSRALQARALNQTSLPLRVDGRDYITAPVFEAADAGRFALPQAQPWNGGRADGRVSDPNGDDLRVRLSGPHLPLL